MIGENIGLIELGLSCAAALGFLGYQYWSVSRSIDRDRARDNRSDDRARHAEGEHSLDDR